MSRLGTVIAGSLEKGLDIRLDADQSVESIAVGQYVTVEGQQRRFFGMITDISLAVTDQQLTLAPPDTSDPFISEVLSGTSTFGLLHVTPMLTIGGDADTLLEGPKPVKTIPSHFSTAQLATEADMETVFGKEDAGRYFIGNPLDMEVKICLDLEEFVKRSNGIFGKSGTGKTFLTRILLIGMLQKSKSVNLIFDMQNEYAWEGTSEGSAPVKGLKQFFGSKVAVLTLDEANAAARGARIDFVVKIGYEEIEPADMVLLRETLNLTELAVEAVYQLKRHFGKSWLQMTLAMQDSEEVKKLLEGLNIHESTFQSLKRGLQTIGRLPFIQEQVTDKAVDRILHYLDQDVNVVLEFGRYRDIVAYILVANLLARRIYERYQNRVEKALGEKTAKPKPLVITIEEAHKFLNHEVAGQTIFGTIAREMRKYNVTLLVIDQRPSGIDEEVMSQLGTKITCLLDNEKDIDAVLSGVSGKGALRSVLARLEPKQQALIFGHALPMPVVVRVRPYGPGSYEDYGYADPQKRGEQAKRDSKELF